MQEGGNAASSRALQARFPLVDSLRATAALSVLLLHVLYQPAVEANIARGLWRFGYQLEVAVPLFFAISGFLLHRPFVAGRARGETMSFGAYAWRRVLRIVPGYWVALTVVALWFGISEVGSDPLRYYGFAQVYSASTALGGLSQAWSLCDEVFYYLMLPLLALAMAPIVRRRGWRLRDELALPVAILAVGVAWDIAAVHAVDPGSAASRSRLLGPLGQIEFFAVGMLLSVVSVWVHERRESPRSVAAARVLARVPGGAWWLGALAFFLLASYGSGIDGSFTDSISRRGYVFEHLCYDGCILCLLAPALFGELGAGRVRQLLGWRPLLWVGAISYSVYLYHFAVYGQEARWLGLPRTGVAVIAMTLLSVVSVIAVAALSYYIVERPAMRLRGWVSAKPRGRVTTYPPPPVPAAAASPEPLATDAP